MQRLGMAVLVGAVVTGGAVLLANSATPAEGMTLAAGRAVRAAATWGRAIEVPRLAPLNSGGRAQVMSVSCYSAGDCTAGGSYEDNRHRLQGFLVSEQNGKWGRAAQAPGLAALNTRGQAEVTSVSCGHAGDCAAGGYYYNAGGQQGFVVDELNGKWGQAAEVPGLAALSAGFAAVSAVSCGPPGVCVAGGYYYSTSGEQGFVASELTGAWSQAIEVPGLAALNADEQAEVSSVSCDPAGDCAAGGSYKDSRKRHQGFVATEQGGVWGGATWIRGLPALNLGGQAGVTSVSCTSAGNCLAGGYYRGRPGQQGFVVTELNGTWGTASQLPGLAALNADGYAKVSSVSCGQPGNCAAGGVYEDRRSHAQGFVASEQNGTWARAMWIRGLPALNAGGSARIMSLSCGQVGNCAGVGNYLDRQGNQQGFVVSGQNDQWGQAIEVPGLASMNAGVADVWSVSCSPGGSCAAGGFYQDRRRKIQGFVVSKP